MDLHVEFYEVSSVTGGVEEVAQVVHWFSCEYSDMFYFLNQLQLFLA